MNSIDSRKQPFHDLTLAAKNGQEKELEDLQDYAESRGFEHDLAIYDVPFFKMKQRRTRLGISDDDLRDFFPLPKVSTIPPTNTIPAASAFSATSRGSVRTTLWRERWRCA